MQYNMEMTEAYQRLIWDIMDIRESKRIRIRELCDKAGITMGTYQVLFERVAEKNSGVKALMAVVDALGYELTIKRKEPRK